MTEKELKSKIFDLIGRGFTYEQIARELGITPEDVPRIIKPGRANETQRQRPAGGGEGEA